MSKTFLITGSMGCIGAWALSHLLKDDVKVVSFDLSENRSRLNLLMSPEEQEKISFVKGDLTNPEQVNKVINDNGITHILHLAALQIPFCKADPIMGARVNVVGTINMFEAARQAGIKHLALASSIGVYGAPENYPKGIISEDADFKPDTLYGVYKQANEGSARVYWQDHGISSVTLRPYTVYGVGRDQGLTSEPTKAMLAAAKGEDFDMTFGGTMQFHFASDVAKQFIEAATKPTSGAVGFNLGTKPVTLNELAKVIEKQRPSSKITSTSKVLPFPEGLANDSYQRYTSIKETPLEQGIKETIEQFEACLADGRLS